MDFGAKNGRNRPTSLLTFPERIREGFWLCRRADPGYPAGPCFEAVASRWCLLGWWLPQ